MELTGASGAAYRYRAWPGAAQTPMAGNFVVIGKGADQKLLLIGRTTDLSRAAEQAKAAKLADQPLYVRLNVSRTGRQEEYEDLTALHPSAATVIDAD